MNDERRPSPGLEHEPSGTPAEHAHGGIDRRDFFRGAAALAIGGLGARAASAQSGAAAGAAATGGGATATSTGAAAGSVVPTAALGAHTERALRWTGPEPAVWARRRAGVDHDVVVVGGGQSGVSIGYGLKRAGVGVDIIDAADPGRAGIWRTIARMHQLRTPKTMAPGPDGGNVALSFRAWYETLHGPAAFDALDRIPRLAWADYLNWFQLTTGTNVRYRTRLVEIEPRGDVLALHLEANGEQRVETTRKLVLANGYAGAGGPNVPEFVRALPASVWTHTTGRIPVETLRGKVVGVVGAGSNAFDAAAVALEGGAAEVHLFSRRSYIDYQGQPPTSTPRPPPAAPVDRGFPNERELGYELPDAVRWGNFWLGERRVASVPLDSLERAVNFANFHIHLDTSLADVALAGRKVAAKAGASSLRFDYLIAATGYRVDLAAQPELARIHDRIALWGDRYKPKSGEENAAGAQHPYLGPGFELLPRAASGDEFLRNIHCFNLGAQLSFGVPVGDVPSMAYHARLVAAVARDLYVDGVDAAAHERYIHAPLTAPDPSPYERAVVGRARAVA